MAEAVAAPDVGRRGRAVLLAGVAFQAAVMLGLIAQRVSVLWRGETVLVQVVPVDPRDLFRGDYVVLGYEFSRFSPGGPRGFGGPQPVSEGQTVYAPLERDPDGRHWHSDGWTTQRPAGGTFLRGQYHGGRVEFGIESFYVQEGKGKAYERAVRERKLWAEVAVTPDGGAAIRRLVIE
jgi:uncharacterized membrane-anchored protein